MAKEKFRPLDDRVVVEGMRGQREHLGVRFRLAEIGPADAAEAADEMEWRLGLIARHEFAPAYPAKVLCANRHIGDAMFLRQVIGGRQAVPAAADDDHVIGWLRVRAAPDLLPVP